MPDNSASRSSISRFIPLGLLVLAGVLFVAFGGLRYGSSAALAENCEGLRDFVAQGGIAAGLAFVLAYAELVALTFAVVVINSWNRLAVSFRVPVGAYQPRALAV